MMMGMVMVRMVIDYKGSSDDDDGGYDYNKG